jgi:hypothetical protein
MKTRRCLAVLLLVLIHFGASAVAQASTKPKKPAVPQDTRKLIKAVNVKTDTIVIVDMLAKTKHAYAIDVVTKVQVGNVPGTFADLKVGMKVDDYVERDNDTLDSITVDTDYASPVAQPSKKKKT